jgi:hypothetical protein
MVAAFARSLSETDKPPREEDAKKIGVSSTRIGQAEAVLKHTPDLAKEVLRGGGKRAAPRGARSAT